MAMTLLLGACAPAITVSSDQDPSQDFKDYKYFAWGPTEEHRNTLYPMFDNELNRKRVRMAIEQELIKRGFIYHEKQADFKVDFHIAITSKTAVDTYHPEQTTPWVTQQVEVFDYTEGTLVVHLVDSETNQLVWQGTAVSVLRPNSNQVEQRIIKAVSKIFENYPQAI